MVAAQGHRERIRKEEKEAIQADQAIKEIDLIRRTFREATAQEYVKSKHEEGNTREVLVQDALDAGYTRQEIANCFNSPEAQAVDKSPELDKPVSPPPTSHRLKVRYRFPGAGRRPTTKTNPWRGPLPKPRQTPLSTLGDFLPDLQRQSRSGSIESRRTGADHDLKIVRSSSKQLGLHKTGLPRPNNGCIPMTAIPVALRDRQLRIRQQTTTAFNPIRSDAAVVMAGGRFGMVNKVAGGRGRDQGRGGGSKREHPRPFPRGRGGRARGSGGPWARTQ